MYILSSFENGCLVETAYHADENLLYGAVRVLDRAKKYFTVSDRQGPVDPSNFGWTDFTYWRRPTLINPTIERLKRVFADCRPDTTNESGAKAVLVGRLCVRTVEGRRSYQIEDATGEIDCDMSSAYLDPVDVDSLIHGDIVAVDTYPMIYGGVLQVRAVRLRKVI